MPETFTISLNGTTDLPAGKIAAVVTSLEMFAAPVPRADPPDVDGFSLEEIGREDVARYLSVYRLLGERWMWFSRLVKPVGELQAILSDPAVDFFAVRFGGRDVGLLELDFRVEGEGGSPSSAWTRASSARGPGAG